MTLSLLVLLLAQIGTPQHYKPVTVVDVTLEAIDVETPGDCDAFIDNLDGTAYCTKFAINSRHPRIELPEPELAETPSWEWADGTACVKAGVNGKWIATPCLEKEPSDVPAIRVLDPNAPGYYCTDTASVCDGKKWSCRDKSRILLTAEDGSKHCVKF